MSTRLMEEVLACVRGQRAAVEGLIWDQLRGRFSVKSQSLVHGMNLRGGAGDALGLWVMRTRTRGGGTAEDVWDVTVMVTVLVSVMVTVMVTIGEEVCVRHVPGCC